jgi:hypothetical protein
MIPLDTGICAPESLGTLLLQQLQLKSGRRNVQMFPNGTQELSLPVGFSRLKNARGVFHFHSFLPEVIDDLSSQGRENEFLLLGPFSKYDIAVRAKDGEPLTCITEYIAGIELRCAAGTSGTVDLQREYFEKTKEPDGILVIGDYPERVRCLI